ncbi:hypothetical protein VS_II0485 [Vibrio atlanticus]|uniref:Uncharacterized protein n=1 Tax=Vibrio atlanticus (strain LGP32) TaxID=575788 RepID=B7VRA0_VIBA3|nr:hypothetical protein VS_II0485 [Vibrio atlanticus]
MGAISIFSTGYVHFIESLSYLLKMTFKGLLYETVENRIRYIIDWYWATFISHLFPDDIFYRRTH